MDLHLHSPDTDSKLTGTYARAFGHAVTLFVVSAYLTDWDTSLKLGKSCRHFRLIIGKDFGITRKLACEKVMKWLPAARKAEFMVADNILGFHPKAIFWQENDGACYALIGSSNLTRAAFEKNYEANIYTEITPAAFAAAKAWVKEIEAKSLVVSEDWLATYKEAPSQHPKAGRKHPPVPVGTKVLPLPTPPDIADLVKARRKQLRRYIATQKPLLRLFRNCASGAIDSATFFERLPELWNWEIGNRLQGDGWERRGKASDFQALSQSFLRILEADAADRDDVVVAEIDQLAAHGVETRRAFLSEMLCLAFPDAYPVLNQPVRDYMKAIRFRAPRGATEGGRYLDLAKKLRVSLLQNPRYPAKNLAELDTVIWRAYGKKAA